LHDSFRVNVHIPARCPWADDPLSWITWQQTATSRQPDAETEKKADAIKLSHLTYRSRAYMNAPISWPTANR